MTVFSTLKNTILAGFGIQEKVMEFIDDLVKRGELSESQGAKLVKEWSQRADKTNIEFNQTIALIVNRTLEKMNLPTKLDIDKLDKKMDNLVSRVKRLEGDRDID